MKLSNKLFDYFYFKDEINCIILTEDVINDIEINNILIINPLKYSNGKIEYFSKSKKVTYIINNIKLTDKNSKKIKYLIESFEPMIVNEVNELKNQDYTIYIKPGYYTFRDFDTIITKNLRKLSWKGSK